MWQGFSLKKNEGNKFCQVRPGNTRTIQTWTRSMPLHWQQAVRSNTEILTWLVACSAGSCMTILGSSSLKFQEMEVWLQCSAHIMVSTSAARSHQDAWGPTPQLSPAWLEMDGRRIFNFPCRCWNIKIGKELARLLSARGGEYFKLME